MGRNGEGFKLGLLTTASSHRSHGDPEVRWADLWDVAEPNLCQSPGTTGGLFVESAPRPAGVIASRSIECTRAGELWFLWPLDLAPRASSRPRERCAFLFHERVAGGCAGQGWNRYPCRVGQQVPWPGRVVFELAA